MAKFVAETTVNFGDWAYQAIAKHTGKFSKHETKVLQDRDPEELHQMRVGMRKLRSAVTGFSLGLDLPQSAQDKCIGKIARTLGKLRDLDVLLEIIEQQYLPDLPNNEQKKLIEALKELKRQRKKVFKLVKSTLEGKEYAQLKNSLQKWLQKPSYTDISKINIQSIIPDLLLPEISKFFLHPGWLIGINLEQGEYLINENLSLETVETILHNQGEILHDLRKEAKRCRYQMELFTQFYGNDYQDYLKDIKSVQTVLGELQDNAVLTKVLSKIIGKNLVEKMPVFSKLMQDDRYHKWQQWQKLQFKFLPDSTRQKFRLVITQPHQLRDDSEFENQDSSVSV